jgi:hypothetical protein
VNWPKRSSKALSTFLPQNRVKHWIKPLAEKEKSLSRGQGILHPNLVFFAGMKSKSVLKLDNIF